MTKLLPAFALLALAMRAEAAPPKPPTLAVLASDAPDDARTAIAIGPEGQVYRPDGKGAWVRTQQIATADRVLLAGRADGVVVLAEGVVYRLVENGWSALRLAQKGKVLMSGGDRAVAIAGRQLFALDRTVKGEPAKLALAPAAVSAIGAGAGSVVIQTERGLLRQRGSNPAWKPIAKPRRVERLVDDRWALVDAGVVDLETGRTTPWPAGFRVGAAAGGAQLLAVGTTRQGTELVTVGRAAATPKAGKPRGKAAAGPAAPVGDRELVTAETHGPPVGVVADRTGRIVVAFRDGTLAVRERGVWTTAMITEDLPAPRPGAPPATSP